MGDVSCSDVVSQHRVSGSPRMLGFQEKYACCPAVCRNSSWFPQNTQLYVQSCICVPELRPSPVSSHIRPNRCSPDLLRLPGVPEEASDVALEALAQAVADGAAKPHILQGSIGFVVWKPQTLKEETSTRSITGPLAANLLLWIYAR